jgi:hypothetical protein
MKLQLKGAFLYADRLYVDQDQIYLYRRRRAYHADRQGSLFGDWGIVGLWPHGIGATRRALAAERRRRR